MKTVQALRLATLGAVLASSSTAWALTTTLPTSALNANGTLTFSADAVNVLNTVNVNRTALGTTTAVGTTGSVFVLPVTSATTAISIWPPSITATSGTAMGSAIGFDRGPGNSLIFGNARLDLSAGKVYADVWQNGVKSYLNIFDFHVAQGLTLSLNGGLNLKEKLDHLTLTTDGVNAFTSALHVPNALKGFLASIDDFGSIDINISPTLRTPLGSVSGKAYNPPPVPEPATYVLTTLGLIAAAVCAARRRSPA